MRRLLRVLLVALITALAAVVVAPEAHAKDSAPVNWWHVKVNLTEDGIAHVAMELEMDFSQVEGRGPVFQLANRQASGQDGYFYKFDVRNIQVSSPTGARTEVQTTSSNSNIQLRVGDKNTVYNTPQTYRLTYEVSGIVSPPHP